ncbi:MAG TPA: TIGR02757 family protein [Bacteroidales bacterium]|nr:TIGR02757 family protein [Bacteroidales bacterium]
MNSSNEIKMLLDKAVLRFNHLDFIENDPIQISHRFIRKEDIEIAGFLSASIAWGQRKTIIRNGWRLMARMDFAPFDFIMEEDDFTPFLDFVHRTFNGEDCVFFLHSLKNIYQNHGGLEQVFTEGFQQDNSIFTALKHFRDVFLEVPHEDRSRKHLSDVSKNSSAKRLNMFLRWMVRNDDKGVDFGLWKNIPMSSLMLPLDVHTGNVGRDLGLLTRRQNDWKAVEEITEILRTFDADDPIKYDFALFGLGVNG